MGKSSVAHLKRQLPVGTEFVAEFCGPVNTRIISNTGLGTMKPSTERITRRRVVSQGGRMVSVFLDGSKKGQDIDLDWRGVRVEESDGKFTLSQAGTDFLIITLQRDVVPQTTPDAKVEVEVEVEVEVHLAAAEWVDCITRIFPAYASVSCVCFRGT